MEEDTKPSWLSKGVIGSVVTIIFGILGALGIVPGITPESLTEVLTVLGVALAGLISLLGRIFAKKPVRLL